MALWEACKEILDFWIDQGVRIFRVDNPHTKPMAFWEWVHRRRSSRTTRTCCSSPRRSPGRR